MIEVVVERESNGDDDVVREAAPVAQIRLGAYRRRGSSRAAMEDCVAVGSEGGVSILNDRDWPSREPSEEITPELAVMRGRAVACAVEPANRGRDAHCSLHLEGVAGGGGAFAALLDLRGAALDGARVRAAACLAAELAGLADDVACSSSSGS